MEQDKIISGVKTSFIDSNIESDPIYRPQFIYNDYLQGKKVLSDINNELLSCDEFVFSVAFITDSGLEPLLMTLKELRNKKIPGKILTTNYLNFTNPKAIRKLKTLSNIDIKMYCIERNSNIGFHTKGYIFRHKDIYHIITGSSNLTKNAISTNKEWNTKIVTTADGEYYKQIKQEFDSLWNSNASLNIDVCLDAYEEQYNKQKEYNAICQPDSVENYKLVPNQMQLDFVRNIKALIGQGETRALLISATGTGKTYAAAFAVRELIRDMGYKKILFVVHREQIAKQAKKSFENVIDTTKISTGLLSGNSKDFEADIIFSTMQTLSKEEYLNRFSPCEFDLIIIDEVHRVGSESYQNIINYFNKPKFLLGMSATPERTDNFDIYKLFCNNIACEIRLQEALENNLLCPFHYFGITDISINGQLIDDSTDETNFNMLVNDERIRNIIDQADYYGYSGDRVKGLIFCRSKEEGANLSQLMNNAGYHTQFLSGENSQIEREDAIDKLTSENSAEYLDYIFTVDIFNEGIDVPEINQVILLRPTQSPIVFVQQLGRGLRKFGSKEYVVILDFIGNYKNNFMIPMALSGIRTNNKDDIRHFMQAGDKIIPGNSTIHFDAITKKRIFDSIDQARINTVQIIKDNYFKLKQKLGRDIRLSDFDKYSELDATQFFSNSNLGSYYTFLNKCDKDSLKFTLDSRKEKYLKYISCNFCYGKRIHELLYLQDIITKADPSMNLLKSRLDTEYHIALDALTVSSIRNLMIDNFRTTKAKDNYEFIEILDKDSKEFKISTSFKEMLKDVNFYNMVTETIDFAIERYNKYYKNDNLNNSFKLYMKYTYKDVCRLLNWEKNQVALNIGGYKYDDKTKTYPIFINYVKSEDTADTQNYNDRFTSANSLIAISKSKRNIKSNDVYTAIHSKQLGVKMDLFVRKNKKDEGSKEFYYLGRISCNGDPKEIQMNNTKATAVEIPYKLEHSVRDDLYHYFVDKETEKNENN